MHKASNMVQAYSSSSQVVKMISLPHALIVTQDASQWIPPEIGQVDVSCDASVP